MVFVIIGCHRTGTSLVASMLEALGVDMGQRFSLPSAINPYGFYEDLDFLELNKEILSAAGGSWHHPPSREGIVQAGAKYSGRILSLVRERGNKSSKWGWKDPRTVLTYPLYAPFLNEVRLIHTVRKWDAVCASLDNWYHDKRDTWKGLVYYYNYLANEYLDGVPSYHAYRISFDDVVNRDKAPRVVEGLAEFVGEPASVPDALDRIRYRRR